MSIVPVAVVTAVTTAAPSIDRLLPVAQREIERFEGARETRLATELFTKGYQLHFAGNPPMGLEGHQGVLDMFHAAFPDLSIKALGQVCEGDRVANHFVMKGTHRAAFHGLPATGKGFTVTGTNLMRFEGERIAELWGQIDIAGMMMQLTGGAAAAEVVPVTVGKAPRGAGDTARRFMTAFNAKDIDAIVREYSEEYVLDFPAGPKGQGLAGIRSAATEFMVAFPDLHFTVEDVVEQGDRAVLRWSMTGTHRGPLGPFARSDKAVRLTGISLFQVRGGKIVSDRVRADMAGLAQQIGSPPAKPN